MRFWASLDGKNFGPMCNFGVRYFGIVGNWIIYFRHWYFSSIDLVTARWMPWVSFNSVVGMSRTSGVKFRKWVFIFCGNLEQMMNFICPWNRIPCSSVIPRTLLGCFLVVLVVGGRFSGKLIFRRKMLPGWRFFDDRHDFSMVGVGDVLALELS